MSGRPLLLAALALLAGCNQTSALPGLRLSGPSAVAVFHGYSTRDAANLRAYLAISDLRGDDLRIIDAQDGKAVLAPGLILSLAVPTAPRPALLAVGGLSDAGGTPQADLLAVAPAGLVACAAGAPDRLSGCIQVVATWTPDIALDSRLTLDLLALGYPDAHVLSMIVVPVPASNGAGGWAAAPGRARLLAGLSGGHLLVADFGRAADGVAIEKGAVAVYDLPFEPVSLSAAPDLIRVFAASPEPVGRVAGIDGDGGVVELDLSTIDPANPTGPQPLRRILPTGAPTTEVLVATVRPFAGLTDDPRRDAYGPPVLRVYAALDPTRCGREEPVACGLVALDPAPGCELLPAPGCLLPDPAGELPSRAPIAVPGAIRALAAIAPPSVGGLLDDGTVAPPGTPDTLQKQATSADFRVVSTLAAAASTTGQVYLVDLGHDGLAADGAVLATVNAGTQARVSAVRASAPSSLELPSLAIWDERTNPAAPAPTIDPLLMPSLIRMTPGYTPTEQWTIAKEGTLPGLTELPIQYQADAGGANAWLAIQTSAGATAASGPFRSVGRLYDPRLPVRPGDIAVVTPTDTARCPLGPFELTVTSILYPDGVNSPGGAVAVAPRPPEQQPTVERDGVQVPADPTCLDGAGRSVGKVSFRAGGLLLSGISFGYAGRPSVQATAAEPGFTLGWEDPAALSCPMPEGGAWPAPSWPPQPWTPPVCDQPCRDQCERLHLSRKARRLFYVPEKCPSTDAECAGRWGADLILGLRGPVLAFKLGLVYGAGAAGTAAPVRGTFMNISTVSGQVPASRRPQANGSPTSAVLPAGLAVFDRAGTSGLAADGVRVFVAYPGNLVLDFSPSLPAAAIKVYR